MDMQSILNSDIWNHLPDVIGFIVAGGFFLLMGYIFYWIFVIAPRRTQEVYAELRMRGYRLLDPGDASIQPFLETHASIFPTDPLIGEDVPEWKCVHGAVKDENTWKRTIINARRTQRDRVGTGQNTTARDTTILIDSIERPGSELFYLVPCRNKVQVRWEKRYGLEKVELEEAASGLNPVLLEYYEVYTKPGQAVSVSTGLMKALIQVVPILKDQSLFCFQQGVTLRFQASSWSICTSNRIYKIKDMEKLMEVAETISASLQ